MAVCVWGGKGVIMCTSTWDILSKLFNLHLPKVEDINMFYWQLNLPKMLNIENTILQSLNWRDFF